jgi:hypothetical protein
MSDVAVSISNLPGVGAEAVAADAPALSRPATPSELQQLRRYALAAGGRIVQGAVMISAGIFLLREIPSTPGLTLQMAILGLLLVAGGAAFVRAGLVGPGDFRMPR